VDRSAEKEQKKTLFIPLVKEKTQERGVQMTVEKKKVSERAHKELGRSGGFYIWGLQ
jgi:hypothetical protein